ncbi:hypothetical protein FE236_01460 [Mariprofundus erugo]|uniref:Flagellar hook-length control protein FliK n=1 Tax=Mariprofundus erugo TaxID=2528639 RepID=A0A5R9GLY7_9PROT|nr:hypothetical protein [Mariprofundus erugo]TLS66698.1 hypothetical protein FEF65_09235 [Mariprofundus erugo]TLS78442.1 hypothetical protein FE236_01460 [Mariprofundus erugo]
MKLPAIVAQTVSQNIRPAGPTGALPWANGTILSGRLEPGQGGMATLIIASQRFQATLPSTLPANMPAGQIWLELLNRDEPARFRILSRQQAVSEIAEKLAELASSRSTDSATPVQRHQSQSSWAWQDHHPLHGYESDNGQRLMLDERDSHQPRGMIERQNDEHGFALHGRIDLEQLGTLYFMLQQQQGGVPQLKLRATRSDSFNLLRLPFAEWIASLQTAIHADQNGLRQQLNSELSHGDEPLLMPRIANRQA